ncbi:MAG: hypothetical protein ACFCVE_10545 [Phycisphaerae bacterium]
MNRLIFKVHCRRADAMAVEPQVVRVEAADEASARLKVESLGLVIESIRLDEVREANPLAEGLGRLRTWFDDRLGPTYGRYAVPAISAVLCLLILWAIVD